MTRQWLAVPYATFPEELARRRVRSIKWTDADSECSSQVKVDSVIELLKGSLLRHTGWENIEAVCDGIRIKKNTFCHHMEPVLSLSETFPFFFSPPPPNLPPFPLSLCLTPPCLSCPPSMTVNAPPAACLLLQPPSWFPVFLPSFLLFSL